MSGEPKAQPRMRHYRRGNFVGGYTPPSADGWKVACAVAAHDAVGKPWTEPIRLALWFRLPRPASHLCKSGALRKGAPLRPCGKPDLDNLAKAVMDALNRIAFNDDAQVVELILGKEYAPHREQAGCIVTMEQVDAE